MWGDGICWCLARDSLICCSAVAKFDPEIWLCPWSAVTAVACVPNVLALLYKEYLGWARASWRPTPPERQGREAMVLNSHCSHSSPPLISLPDIVDRYEKKPTLDLSDNTASNFGCPSSIILCKGMQLRSGEAPDEHGRFLSLDMK